MNIINYDRDPASPTHDLAIIEVEAGETADIEEMLRLLTRDGRHAGVEAKLIATEQSINKQTMRLGVKPPLPKGGYRPGFSLRLASRFYEVQVHRYPRRREGEYDGQ
jgi:hypothetical protein